MTAGATDAARGAMDAAREHGLTAMARIGYAARGVIYAIIGVFALLAAFSQSGTTDARGALGVLFDRPFGRVLVGIVALGLFAHALWRFVQVARNLDPPSGDPQPWRCHFVRLGRAGSGLAYLLLAISATGLAFGWEVHADSAGQSTRDWTRWLLARPFGQALTAMVGAIVIAVGVGKFVRAAAREPGRWVNMRGSMRRWAKPVARIGYAARGVLFCLIGLFLLVAALRRDPSEAQGLSDTLRMVREQPLGMWLLAIVALGLLSYSAHSLVEAGWRRVREC